MPEKEKTGVTERVFRALIGQVPGVYTQRFRREKRETNVARMRLMAVFIVGIQLLMNILNILRPTPAGQDAADLGKFVLLSLITLAMGVLFLLLSVLIERGVIKSNAVKSWAPYVLLYGYMAIQLIFFAFNVQMSGSGGNSVIIALLLTLLLVLPPIQSVVSLLVVLLLEVMVLYGMRNVSTAWSDLFLSDAWANTLIIAVLVGQISIMVYNSYQQNFLSQVRLAGSNRQLEKIAQTDSLTEILNRRGFFKELDQNWAEYVTKNKVIAACMFDIDYFKRFNDRFGHLVGDKCLHAVSQVLKEALEGEDGSVLCRYGGEEFLTIYRGASVEEVEEAANRARLAVGEMRIAHEQDSWLGVTISGGLSYGHGDVSCDELIRLADDALYEAKERGRNRICVSEQTL